MFDCWMRPDAELIRYVIDPKRKREVFSNEKRFGKFVKEKRNKNFKRSK